MPTTWGVSQNRLGLFGIIKCRTRCCAIYCRRFSPQSRYLQGRMTYSCRGQTTSTWPTPSRTAWPTRSTPVTLLGKRQPASTDDTLPNGSPEVAKAAQAARKHSYRHTEAVTSRQMTAYSSELEGLRSDSNRRPAHYEANRRSLNASCLVSHRPNLSWLWSRSARSTGPSGTVRNGLGPNCRDGVGMDCCRSYLGRQGPTQSTMARSSGRHPPSGSDSSGSSHSGRFSSSRRGGVLAEIADQSDDILGYQSADCPAGIDADDHLPVGVEHEARRL